MVRTILAKIAFFVDSASVLIGFRGLKVNDFAHIQQAIKPVAMEETSLNPWPVETL